MQKNTFPYYDTDEPFNKYL
jgi:hypothetical protein